MLSRKASRPLCFSCRTALRELGWINISAYVRDFKQRLYGAGAQAREKLAIAQEKIKPAFDCGSENYISGGDQIKALCLFQVTSQVQDVSGEVALSPPILP